MFVTAGQKYYFSREERMLFVLYDRLMCVVVGKSTVRGLLMKCYSRRTDVKMPLELVLEDRTTDNLLFVAGDKTTVHEHR